MTNSTCFKIGMAVAAVWVGLLGVAVFAHAADGYCPPHIPKAIDKIAENAKNDPLNASDYDEQIDRLLDVGDCRELIPWIHIKSAIGSAVDMEVSKQIARAENAFRAQTNAWQAQFDIMGASLGPDLAAAVAKNAQSLDRRIDVEQTRIDHLNKSVQVLTVNVAMLTDQLAELNDAIKDIGKAAGAVAGGVAGANAGDTARQVAKASGTLLKAVRCGKPFLDGTYNEMSLWWENGDIVLRWSGYWDDVDVYLNGDKKGTSNIGYAVVGRSNAPPIGTGLDAYKVERPSGRSCWLEY